MIHRITIENFKSFQEKGEFRLKSINLLTGINGRGKSSLLQTILLLAQSLDRRDNLDAMFIQGCNVDLGNYYDIKNSYSKQSQSINFGIAFDDDDCLYESLFCYTSDENNQLKAKLIKAKSFCNSEKLPEAFNCAFKKLKYVHYVSADRLGPTKYFDKTELPEFMRVGSRGEYSMAILGLSNNLGLTVNENLYLGKDSMSLLQQTSEWMSYILDGAKVKVKGVEKESSVLYMLLNNRNDEHEYKPMNVGFGYSYILPLVVSGLIAKPGEILIVENPEAHLHPRAQSRITEFFAKVASTGVQVFIESHSEHILNSLRLSSVKKDIMINSDDISIYYFDEEFGITNLTVDAKGKIKNWPKGFFDQQEIDLANIFKASMMK